MIIAVAIVIGGYALAALRAVGAQSDLDATNAKTAQILAEKQKYVSASAVAGQVAAIQAALKTSASTEVLWYTQYAQIDALLPSGALLVAGKFSAPSPMDSALTPLGPLRDQTPVAVLKFQVAGISMPAAVDLLPQLDGLPGFADATLDEVKVAHDVHTSFFTLDLTAKSFSGRFADGNGNS